MPSSNRIPASPEGICPLLNGRKIPEVTLSMPDGSPVGLAAATAGKPTVLVFYRGGW